MDGCLKHPIAGRVELIRTVIHNSISYWIRSFNLPLSVIGEIDSLSVNFLWNNRMHAWGWGSLCQPKSEGGTDIRRLADTCKAAGMKLVWRLCTSNSLWANWMRNTYLTSTPLALASSSLLDWKLIISHKEIIFESMRMHIRDGTDTCGLILG